ncbi:MAG: hypothetical protein QOE90_1329 [Thermoplasmata archaeon]|jgi:hypothetical protein|nr:hypothetical protein [Thermoplasmata archaeon]
MSWSLLETAMKATTFAGVVLCATLLARAGRWSGHHTLGLVGGAAGVALMVVANRALDASLGGLLVDALYAGLAGALAVRAWRTPRAAPLAPVELPEGGERGA